MLFFFFVLFQHFSINLFFLQYVANFVKCCCWLLMMLAKDSGLYWNVASFSSTFKMKKVFFRHSYVNCNVHKFVYNIQHLLLLYKLKSKERNTQNHNHLLSILFYKTIILDLTLEYSCFKLIINKKLALEESNFFKI